MIYLEGNIGCGKTTLGYALAERFGVHFLEEPVDQWRTFAGVNFVDRFHSDMSRWGFTFQVLCWVTRKKSVWEIPVEDRSRPIVQERSIHTDLHVFSRVLVDMGAMSPSEQAIYELLHAQHARRCASDGDCGFWIYVRTPAAVCRHRILQRKRPEEMNIDPTFLESLEHKHDLWLLGNPLAVTVDGEASVESLADSIIDDVRRVWGTIDNHNGGK